jgi:hypothetical protein
LGLFASRAGSPLLGAGAHMLCADLERPSQDPTPRCRRMGWEQATAREVGDAIVRPLCLPGRDGEQWNKPTGLVVDTYKRNGLLVGLFTCRNRSRPRQWQPSPAHIHADNWCQLLRTMSPRITRSAPFPSVSSRGVRSYRELVSLPRSTTK